MTPLEIFIDGNGKEVEVFNSVDVKEWEKAGFQKKGSKKRAKKKPATPKVEAPKVEQPQPVQPTQPKLVSDGVESVV